MRRISLATKETRWWEQQFELNEEQEKRYFKNGEFDADLFLADAHKGDVEEYFASEINDTYQQLYPSENNGYSTIEIRDETTDSVLLYQNGLPNS